MSPQMGHESNPSPGAVDETAAAAALENDVSDATGGLHASAVPAAADNIPSRALADAVEEPDSIGPCGTATRDAMETPAGGAAGVTDALAGMVARGSALRAAENTDESRSSAGTSTSASATSDSAAQRQPAGASV